MPYKTIEDLDLAGKKVFMRVDFNVPLDKETGKTITSDTRIRAALPSIRLALDNGASVILASHLGRPKGKREPKMSLAPVAVRLSELLGKPVKMAADCVGEEAEKEAAGLAPGDVLLLENLRYHAGEEANDEGFARKLASLADVYVNDAFGAAHRAHASTAGIVPFVSDAAAGLLMHKELTWLGKAVVSPEHPLRRHRRRRQDLRKDRGHRELSLPGRQSADRRRHGLYVLQVAGQGRGRIAGRGREARSGARDPGPRRRQADAADGSRDRLGLSRPMPRREIASVDEPVPAGWMGLDIGPKTIAAYEQAVAGAKMIVWNGPMGVFELEPFAAGTLAIAKAVAAADAVSIVGGGDSEKAIQKAGVGAGISHVSTGGGASLEFLSGVELPGVAALGGL